MAGLVESDPAAKDAATLRILHLSDTHGLHNSLEQAFPFPPADILIHTGDFTDGGREDEFRSFDEWLASLRPRYRDIIVISGNHEYKSRNSPALTVKGGLKALLPNGPTAVLEHESAFVRGLHVFGSGWVPGHKSASPGDSSHPGSKVVQHRFDEIPGGVDLLLTHGAPHGILDCCEEATLQWGGSFALRAAVERVKPTAHFFGHMHEQRGIWQRVAPGGPFACRIEYTEPSASRPNGKPHPTWGVDGLVSLSGESVPPEDYPCQLISCNAQCNHRIMEGIETKRLVGPARLVVASRDAPGLAWRFQVPEVELEQAQHQSVAASIDGGGANGGAGESKQCSD